MGIRTNDFITFNADNNPFSIEFDGTTATFKIGATSVQTMTTSGITHSSGLTETFNSPINVGVDGTGHDVQFFGDTSGKKFFWDQSADTLFLPCTVDIDGVVTVGVDDTGYDVTFFGATSGKKFFWDESADTLFLPATVDIDGTVTVGVDDTGYDVKFFGATTGKSLLWDESADTLIVTGELTVTNTVPASFAAGLRTKQAVTNVNDTTPTAAELTTAFGNPATIGRGFIGTVDDNDGDAIGYIVWASDASYYFIIGTKAT